MNYHMPSDDEIVKVITNYNLDTNPFTTSVVSEGISKLHSDLVTATKIANLNTDSNYEYIRYLIHFRRYIRISEENIDSSLRVMLEDHYKLKELHKLL